MLAIGAHHRHGQEIHVTRRLRRSGVRLGTGPLNARGVSLLRGVDGDALAGVVTRCRGVFRGEERRSGVRLRRKDDKLDVVGCNLKWSS